MDTMCADVATIRSATAGDTRESTQAFLEALHDRGHRARGHSQSRRRQLLHPHRLLPPDAYAAMMAAKQQGSRVEVLDDRTDASQTFANPEGTFSYETSAVPRWVQKDGAWKELDATLQPTASGGYAPVMSESALLLSAGGTGPLATMTVDGKQLRLTWPDALPKPTVDGATLTYPDVLASGVDLPVTATPAGGAEETLVVKNAAAAADPALADLVQSTSTSVGTTLSVDAGGNLTVTDAKGTALVTSPAPVMWDSATSTATSPAADTPDAIPSSATTAGGTQAAALGKVTVATAKAGAGTRSSSKGPGTHAHKARVKVTLAKHKLHLVADQGMLTSASTVFPVYLDPAYVPHPASGSTLHYDEVQEGYPTTSNYDAAPGSGLDHVGHLRPPAGRSRRGSGRSLHRSRTPGGAGSRLP